VSDIDAGFDQSTANQEAAMAVYRIGFGAHHCDPLISCTFD
jgi:hypothetical protein